MGSALFVVLRKLATSPRLFEVLLKVFGLGLMSSEHVASTLNFPCAILIPVTVCRSDLDKAVGVNF